MLLDQPVVLAIDGAWKRFVRVVGNIGRTTDVPPGAATREGAWSAIDWQQSIDQLVTAQATDRTIFSDTVTEERSRVATSGDPAMPLPAESAVERRVDSALVRARLLSGQGRFEEAEAAFAEALGLDPVLDLAGHHAFWEIERGGQDAAARALESAGRSRDAMILRSRLENRYRPRLVRTA